MVASPAWQGKVKVPRFHRAFAAIIWPCSGKMSEGVWGQFVALVRPRSNGSPRCRHARSMALSASRQEFERR
jgi:hypothetical protein